MQKEQKTLGWADEEGKKLVEEKFFLESDPTDKFMSELEVEAHRAFFSTDFRFS